MDDRPIDLPPPSAIGGLTAQQVAQRRKKGQVNTPPRGETRSAGRIVAENVLSLFNLVNLCLAVLLVACGAAPRQILFFGVALFSTAMCIVQELRAKRTLDSLSILSHAQAGVVRDGVPVRVRTTDIVLGDIVRLDAGDQVTVDGVCTHALGLALNEALVTGEADEVDKSPGDRVLSGSFVVAGSGYIRATAVGGDSFAARLSVEAQREKRNNSRIMAMLRRIVTVLAISLFPMGAVLFLSRWLGGIPGNRVIVETVAPALIGMIPQGLILLTNVAFAVGVINLGRRGVLVQALPCIEALARVDTLCLDKTGTITTGEMSVSGIHPLMGFSCEDVRVALRKLLRVLPGDNRTAMALKTAFTPQGDLGAEGEANAEQPLEIIPFSSSRKYSGVRFEGETLLLGAPAFVLPGDVAIAEGGKALSQGGRRVLLLATGEERNALRGIGFVVLEDSVRENAGATFDYFGQQGIDLKVISGDDPVSVSGVAARAGLPRAGETIDLSAYAACDPSQQQELPPLRAIDTEKTVFGRVSPYQKRMLVRLMRENGRTVAMTGDGVNDVLALKEADCGVAMADGSAAVRSCADLVLLNSDFAGMIPAAREGRRVINNIEKVAPLYLNKTILSAILALIFVFFPGDFPFSPLQLTLIGALTIGAPSFVLTLQPNYRIIHTNLVARVASEAIPNALAVVITVLTAHLVAPLWALQPADVSAMCAAATGLLGLGLLFRVSRPLDTIRTLLLVAMTVAFAGAAVLLAPFFELEALEGLPGLLTAPLAVLGFAWAWLIGKLFFKRL